MTSTLTLVLFALLAVALVQCSHKKDKSTVSKLHDLGDDSLKVLEQCGDDDMKKTAAKLRKIEKEVMEAIETAKMSIQKFVNIPSVLIKDTVMKGMKGLVESTGTVFKTAQKTIDAIKTQVPKVQV